MKPRMHKQFAAAETVPEYLARIGRAGGSKTSARKARAARINGKKGAQARKRKGEK
jgi:hypothetical protein